MTPCERIPFATLGRPSFMSSSGAEKSTPKAPTITVSLNTQAFVVVGGIR